MSTHRFRRLAVVASCGGLAAGLALTGGSAGAAESDSPEHRWQGAATTSTRPMARVARETKATETTEVGTVAKAGTPSGDWVGGAWTSPRKTGLAEARDLRSVDLYTRKGSGSITAVGKFQAPPTKANTVLLVFVGVRDGSGCRAVSAVAGATTGGQAEYATINNAGGVIEQASAGTATRVDRRVVLEVKSAKLKGRATACAYAAVTNGGSTNFDSTGFIDTGSWPQHLEQYFGANIGGAENTPPHTGMVVGKSRVIRIGVKNSIQGTDTSDVVGVRLGAGGKNLTVTPGFAKLGTIGLVRDKSARFNVTLKKAKTATLRWTAVGDYGVTSDAIKIHPLGAPVGFTNSMVGKRFWARTNLDWQQKGIWFVNSQYAYIGFPAAGGKPACSSVTSNGTTRGCVRYTWNNASKTLKIHGQDAGVLVRNFTWKGSTYKPMVTPAAGSRWFVSLRHTNATTSGTLEYLDLDLRMNGRFWYDRQTYAARMAMGEGSGTYTVGSNGLLTLKYDSGTTKKTNIAILTGNDGRPNPWDVGLFVGDQEYEYY